jgi:hypothetical protein
MGSTEDKHILKFQRLQNKVLRTIHDVPKLTPTRDLHMAFRTSYVYDYVTKICKYQAEVVQNLDNVNIRNTRQRETDTGNLKG